ncbi:hypothetical protein Tco_0615792 [Tanacetum coccineum]
MSSLASVLLWLRVFADLLVLIFLFACPCRDALSGSNCECTSLFLSPNHLKTFLSLGPSLVNTVVLTRLLRRVGLSPSCLSLENTLAVCEGRVPLDAVTGLCLLFLGLFFLSHDSDSENCAYFSKLIRRETPKIADGCLLTPLVGCVSDCRIGGSVGECHCWTPESRDEVRLITCGACSVRACRAAELMFLAAMCRLLLVEWSVSRCMAVSDPFGLGPVTCCEAWACGPVNTIRHQ